VKTFTADVILQATSMKTFTADVTLIQTAEDRGFYYAKLGSTILTSLKKDSFRITEELNKIPSFEFEISNCSANRTTIAAGITDTLTIYRRRDSMDTLMFTGRIDVDAIEYLSIERIRIPGYASYIDLNFRFHQHLNSEDAENVDKVVIYPYSTEYTYYKKGAVNATTAGAQSNYQLELVVGESSGASGVDVHCNGHCEDFPNDIRFTKEGGAPKHDYWVDLSSLEGNTPNRKVRVWIEVASIPTSGTVDFYMYYGLSGDSGESNGDTTFPFFDAFTAVYANPTLDTLKHKCIKDDSNPIFSPNTGLPTEAGNNFNSISVAKEGSTYYMIYSSNYATLPTRCICGASSSDGKSWTRFTAKPIIDKGSPGAWDDQRAAYMKIVTDLDGNLIKHNNQYQILYMGRRGVDSAQIGRAYANSMDSTWTKDATNPIFSPDDAEAETWEDYCNFSPLIFKEGNTYYMLYGAGRSDNKYRIGLATSTNLVDWTRDTAANPVLEPTASAWDSERVIPEAIYKQEGTYYLIYGGYDTTNYRQGIATSTDLKNWTKWSKNPIINIGPDTAWDDIYVDHSSVLIIGGKYYVYYTGGPNIQTSEIGLAYTALSGTLEKWPETLGSPYIESGILKLDGDTGILTTEKSWLYNIAVHIRAKVAALYPPDTHNFRGGLSNSALSVSFAADDGAYTYIGGVSNKFWSASSNDGSLTENNLGDNTSNFYELLMKWKSGEVKFYVDGSLKCTHTTNIPNENLNPRIDNKGGEEGQVHADWFFICKSVMASSSLVYK
jgi:predicted GH43/DUF377 family glycosyl hydrolase